MDREQEIRRFFLLQVNDALFPIGGYSHSQGLETYIQQGSVCDEKTAAEYIHKKLRFALAYTDLLAVRLAWELADQNDADGLDELEEIQRFRISSIEPNLLTDDIIHFVASSQRFMPHFHVPLQSGSNEVLHLMRRRYERELFAEKVQEIKTLIPDAFIGVDVIAGMRGETPEAFEDARQFIAGLDVSQLHVFPYSERSGTKALDIPYIVPQAEKHRRVNVLLDISEQKLHDFYTAHVGQTRPVLFEESDIAGSIGGFTDNYIRVEVPYDPSLANRIVPVELKTDIFGS